MESFHYPVHSKGFPGSPAGKKYTCNARDPSSIPESGRSPGELEPTQVFLGFPSGSDGKESACKAGDLGSILGWEDPLEKEMATPPGCLPGKSHGQRSLVGYSPGVAKSGTQFSD